MRFLVGFVAAAVLAGAGGLAFAQEAAGKWTGMIKTPAGDLPIVVTVSKGADGALTGGLESPSQAPGMIIPLANLKANDELFSFDAPSIQGDFTGVWQDDRKSWSGAWTQGGRSLPLELAKSQ